MHPFQFTVTAGGLTSVDEVKSLARTAEDNGYAGLTIADHFEDQLAPLLALAVAAETSASLRLSTLVLANDYRNPVVLARELATLDQISNGRLDIGIGAGWMKTDYDQTGIAYDTPGTRIARLGESVEIIKRAFGTEPFSFEGQHYNLSNVVPVPASVQDPHPPFLIAGGRRKILTLAAQHADIIGLNPSLHAGVIDERAGASATPASTDQKLIWIRDGAGDRFDHIRLQTRVHLAVITDDRQGVAEMMAPALGLSVDDAMGTPHALVGTVDQCAEALQRWRERWGISIIGLSADAVETMAPVVERLAGT